jgi:hypothetical protein
MVRVEAAAVDARRLGNDDVYGSDDDGRKRQGHGNNEDLEPCLRSRNRPGGNLDSRVQEVCILPRCADRPSRCSLPHQDRKGEEYNREHGRESQNQLCIGVAAEIKPRDQHNSGE